MSERNLGVAAAVAFAVVAGYRVIGLPPVVIGGGGSSAIGLAMWLRTTGGRAADPDLILPPFLLTVAALETHMAAEFTHFIFPLLRPAIQPELPGTVSQAVSNGRFIADMPNYWVGTTGRYYVPASTRQRSP